MTYQDDELEKLLLQRHKQREEGLRALEASQGSPVGGVLATIAGGFADTLGGGKTNYMHQAQGAYRQAQNDAQSRRLKALDDKDATIQPLIELAKIRSGERREDRRSERMIAAQEKKDSNRLQEMAGSLRKEYIGLPTTKQTQDVSASIERVRQAGANPSAAGDLGLIFNYMKMLDPGSTVREGEFANAQNAAGVPEQVRNLWNRAKSGERLNPAQRMDFMTQAERQYQAQLDAQKNFESQYSDLARRLGVSPQDVLMTFSPAQIQQAQGGGGGGGLIPNAHAGQSKLNAQQEARRQELLRKKAASQGAAQ